ncbi:class III extradiol ring-cleavage dioxygenase [Pokkaliibacter sp. MBI-7]|uniref:dioxygenase family protein n=1 Tax=Pokkaliibacter sp. MBI-7 TaxID=3040600 RepID=UPI00244D0D12|nr:class III extradiol ring-cleavage dioxygenase [Pokkaliibacter sp. MBI-7]MDH2433476.1 class III extradiol ring-cleavage dioxygenase [Pokkaliibacter sp. MBI-7]
MTASRRSFLRHLSGLVLGTGSLSVLNVLAATPSTPLVPALFIGHGSPMNALENNPFTLAWDAMAKTLAGLPKPRAILCVSAHWQTPVSTVSVVAKPATIYDFYGFPGVLYMRQYRAMGVPESLQWLQQATTQPLAADAERGLDHGAWVVLSRLFPRADVPVFQLSLGQDLDFDGHYQLAAQLAQLRRRGVMVIGSGNMVHNLRSAQEDTMYGMRDQVHGWAQELDQRLLEAIDTHDHLRLRHLPVTEPTLFAQGHPTPEHFLPLLYPLAMQDKQDELRYFAKGFAPGSISMTSLLLMPA